MKAERGLIVPKPIEQRVGFVRTFGIRSMWRHLTPRPDQIRNKQPKILTGSAQAADPQRQPYARRIGTRIWVEPELLAEVEHRAKSPQGNVAQPACARCARPH